jgi:hypothetical protein
VITAPGGVPQLFPGADMNWLPVFRHPSGFSLFPGGMKTAQWKTWQIAVFNLDPLTFNGFQRFNPR